MLSLHNNRSSHNQTDETWSNSDRMKYNEFRDQLSLVLKILYTLISILIITGNTLVLLVTWRDRSLHQPNKYFVACLVACVAGGIRGHKGRSLKYRLPKN